MSTFYLILKCSFIRSYQCAQQGIFKDFYNAQAEEELIPLNYTIPDDLAHSYIPIVSDIEARRLMPARPKNPKAQSKEEYLEARRKELLRRLHEEEEDDEDFDEFLSEIQKKMKKGQN